MTDDQRQPKAPAEQPQEKPRPKSMTDALKAAGDRKRAANDYFARAVGWKRDEPPREDDAA